MVTMATVHMDSNTLEFSPYKIPLCEVRNRSVLLNSYGDAD